MKLKLYGSPLSPYAARCRIQLYAKGINDVEFLPPPGGLASPEFIKINPTGKIPALSIDGRVLGESQVICDYIEDAYPEPPLRPTNPLDRAQMNLLARMADLYILAPVFNIIPQLIAKDPDEHFIKNQLVAMDKGVANLEETLKRDDYEGGDYAVGNSLTLADCALVPALLIVAQATPTRSPSESLEMLPPLVTKYWQQIQKNEYCSQVTSEMTEALPGFREAVKNLLTESKKKD